MKIVPILVIIFVVVQFVRALLNAQKRGGEHDQTNSESDEQRRMREIQERIRKKIAERRGGASAEPPATFAPEQPRPRPTVMAPPPVSSGPLETTIPREIFRKVVTPRPPPRMPAAGVDATAVLARQMHLEEQMRELESARVAAGRRATHLAAEQAAVAQAEVAAKARQAWLGDLRDPTNVRRAIVLREVLGTPVGLR